MKKKRKSFAATAAASTAISGHEKSLVCGAKIFCTDSMASSAATTSTISAITSAAIVSARRCPKGCSLSAGFSLIFRPISETTLLPQSVRLFMPSASTDSAPVTAPSAIFAAASRVLTAMPIPPESAPIRARRAAGVLFCFIVLTSLDRRVLDDGGQVGRLQLEDDRAQPVVAGDDRYARLADQSPK